MQRRNETPLSLQERLRSAGKRTMRRLWITCATLLGVWLVLAAWVHH